MKNIWFFLISLSFASCLGDDLLGATVGDCDEYCTVYNAPKNILMDKYHIYDKNFPGKDERKNHITKLNETFILDSWFYTIDKQEDTIYMKFSCSVKFDSEKIEYVVSDLKDEYR